jgi:2-polyprenyl-6-methoxyphenol hydroxylase-like FAD-dependent oxidoreductase
MAFRWPQELRAGSGSCKCLPHSGRSRIRLSLWLGRRLHVSQPMKVAVAGGSLAGLMTGIEIRFAGAEVEIHERSAGILDDRGAGIVMQPETLQMLTQRCGLAEEESGVWLNYRQCLQPGGEPAARQRMPQLMTSWGLLYRALRSAFPAEHYYEDSPLTEFSCGEFGVSARF